MKKGFSITELLTVMLILIILAAATYPVFFRARARVKQSVCESNLHQVYLGIKLYESDYGELPPMCTSRTEWWWKNYTGGTHLICANLVSKPNSRDSYQVWAGAKAIPPMDEKLRICREKRGSDFPYAFDANHRSRVDGYQGNGERVILVRESGAVFNVPYPIDDPFSLRGICGPDLPTELQL